MSDDRFAAHTRSASFALTLSQPMISRLLGLELDRQLTEKYPWHRPHEVNFGSTPAESVAQCTDQTMRGLLRRGLVNVVIPDQFGFLVHECFPLTRAGELLCGLLREADFVPAPSRKVPPHPDDRIRLHLDGRPDEYPEHDRRDWENDAPYLSEPRMDRLREAAR